MTARQRKSWEQSFISSYIDTALWSSVDEETREPLNRNYSHADIDRDSHRQMIADCLRFIREAEDYIDAAAEHVNYHSRDLPSAYAQAGHDFWLTRNRHGAGFWDGDWPEPQARLLTNLAHSYGEQNLYRDGGFIYVYPAPGMAYKGIRRR